MQRFVGLLFLVFFAFPLGLSVVGCGHGTATVYCNGEGYGITTGQVDHINLAPTLVATGISLNYGQMGPSSLSASAVDCENNPVTVTHYTYETSDMSIADINPTTGQVCAGSWNRNTGGGIANYTVCTPPASPTNHTAFITATASGGTSNPIEVYIHPAVTGIVLGNTSTSCPTDANHTAGTDPASNCSVCNPNTVGITQTAPVYTGNSCLSQTQTGQLVARVYANGTTNPADNISCQVGPISFSLQGNPSVAAVNANGFITADLPGSALVTATVANASSAVNNGYVSTCPPASIVLTPVNQTPVDGGISVALNTPQELSATVTDTQGKPITGLALTFTSTLPVNFPVTSGTVTPAFPGTATITAACQPPSCNPAPFSQIGYLGNGKPVTSNGLLVTAPGTPSDVLYMGSTNSQYIASEDFTTGQLASPVKLPYVPNSMVISQDGSTIYMGSAGGLETLATGTGAVGGPYQSIQGTVLSVAPNNEYAVITDATRNTVSLVSPSGAVTSSFNGVGTHAEWTPDSSTLYVTTPGNQLLTFSTFVGWESTTISDQTQYNDVAVTVPSYGAYFAGANTTDGRSYCATTTENTGDVPVTTNNVFTPLASVTAVATDRLAATTDGAHILGATVTTTPARLVDLNPALTTSPAQPNGPEVCTTARAGITFNTAYTTHPLTGITASAITGIVPASNSAVAFVTYTGSGGVLPLYAPATGTVTPVALSGGATSAPIAGVFSTDNTTIYAGASGDNLVHIISVTGTTGKESGTINPALPGANGGIATPNLIVSHARRATS